MKLFGNIYTSLALQEIIPTLLMPSWSVKKIDDHEYQIAADNVALSIEGRGEFLIFGELDIAIELVDQWVQQISILEMSYSIDLHGDEARLMRRYQQ